MSTDATQATLENETDTTAPPAKKPAKPATPTDYMVLQQAEPDDDAYSDRSVWVELGTAKGSNANQAIGKLAGDEPDGTFVAVPARSWRPVKPTVKVETKVSWS